MLTSYHEPCNYRGTFWFKLANWTQILYFPFFFFLHIPKGDSHYPKKQEIAPFTARTFKEFPKDDGADISALREGPSSHEGKTCLGSKENPSRTLSSEWQGNKFTLRSWYEEVSFSTLWTIFKGTSISKRGTKAMVTKRRGVTGRLKEKAKEWHHESGIWGIWIW